MALKFVKTNAPPQNAGKAPLDEGVAAGAIDCTEISPALPPADLVTLVPQTQQDVTSSVNAKEPEKSTKSGHLATRTLSSVTPCGVEWLWEPYLPVGEVTILSGDPAVGKTWIALAISADLTCGRTPFTHEPRLPATVLYLTVENSPERLHGRFTSQAGNLDLVHITDSPVWLSDIPSVDCALHKTKAKLMVVDPLPSFLGPDVDTRRAGKIRPVLDALSRLAKKHGCCILLIRHLNKASAGRALYRGSGGIDLSAAARSELLAGHAANDKKQFALVHLKSNLGPYGASLGYAIGDKGLSWTGESDLTADDLLAPESHRPQGEAMAEAKDFLLTTLSQGPRLVNQLKTEAAEAGISFMTLKRAKKQLKIGSKKIGQSGPSEWSLPEGAQGSSTQDT